ncbi:EamA family transporter [Nitrosovibrio tenuis]|uniref:EamA-like transporter family protein n=1 Tax=Nitrosovibrio tenuis TaxID=1233 RepID=A0A1H7LVR6_9PROT|nr:EamA family transporter [Nitrosovibrio tenuis]SEL02818.1 EamA-like transporter family protein [Nitrosovibrio tenuis]
MTEGFLVLVVLSQAFMVGGQIFLKHALNKTEVGSETAAWTRAAPFVYGIGLMTLWFFLWLWLLSKVELSYLYPFDALSPLFMAFGASVALKERMTPRLWCGVLLIVSGLLIVGASQ